eukprot:Gb_13638 [translate_table: standard]
MAPSSWIPLLEAFVNPDKPAQEQGACLDAITSLTVGGQLTIQVVVSDMEMYLTTTDNAVRARGILLLAEILTCLRTKPLDDSSIHSLATFYTSRLADWQALRGAVIGCLALLRRKNDVGLVSAADARKLAQSYLENLQVQALTQQDRMLCLELLECLLDVYADAVSPLGDDLVYGVCAAIDEEKDPRCLLLAFHIVELVVRLFPDAEGPVGNCTEDLFDIISRYFPISFTPPPNDSLGITREDLSRALMGAFTSSPLFAPFCIPLLLDKLSSTLRVAKVDSLKYLGKCAFAYGVDAISSHATAIWAGLKNEMFIAVGTRSEISGPTGFGESEVVEVACSCVTECILAFHKGQDTGELLRLVIEDEHLEGVFKSIRSEASGNVIPSKKELRIQVQALGGLLSAAAKASQIACSVVSQRFLPPLLDTMGVPLDGVPDLTFASNGRTKVNCSVAFGVLYLCHQILEANRNLAEHLALKQDFPLDLSSKDSWLPLLRHLANPLTIVFASAISAHDRSDCQGPLPSTENELMHLGVAGLQALATFPGSFAALNEEQYIHVLQVLVSVLLKRHKQMFLWEQVLGALVQIGISIEKFNDTKNALRFSDLVIAELLSHLATDKMLLPISLNLKAITAICSSSSALMPQVLQGFRQVISANFLQASIKGEGNKAMELVVHVLECLSSDLLPWCQKVDSNEEAIMQLALDIWSSVQEISTFNVHPPGQLLEATMAVLRLLVQRCAENLQKVVLLKAFNVLSLRPHSLPGANEVTTLARQDDFHANINSFAKSNREEWQIALFASVVVALRPNVIVHNESQILIMFMSTVLSKGDNIIKDAAAQALGSMINKCPVQVNKNETSIYFTLEEAIHSVFEEGLLKIVNNCGSQNQSEMVYNDTLSLRLGDLNVDGTIGVQIQAVTAVAWIGKALAMRGHNKTSDIAMLLLSILRSSSKMHTSEGDNYMSKFDKGMDLKYQLASAAADGFGIIMKDSRTSLNKDCHALIRPLYKQRFFTSMIPILVLAIKEVGMSPTRSMLYRAFGHLISEAPHVALLAESHKLLPFILDGIVVLSSDPVNKDLLHPVLLALSGILLDENNGRALAVEHVSTIVTCLLGLVSYPYSMPVRETVLQCLGAIVGFPYARIFPLRTQVLKALSKALDDRKRSVRKEAVRCHQAWASITSRSSLN